MLLPICLLNVALASGSFVKLPFNKNNQNKEVDLSKRDYDGDADLQLTEERAFFSVDLKLGTPPQDLTLLVDTGSADTIIISNTNPYCSGDLAGDCQVYGTFDSSQSSSYVNSQTQFSISYSDGTTSTGDWSMDNIQMSDGGEWTSMPLNFGLGSSTDSVNVLGIGLPSLEITNYQANPYQYVNFPQQLKQSNIINNVIYSLYLDDDNNSGNLLFGAVDQSKYQAGSLYTLPIVNAQGQSGSPSKFYVNSQNINLVDESQNKQTLSSSNVALIDSGSTMIRLPSDTVAQIANKAGAVANGNSGYYIIECSKKYDDAFTKESLEFDFGGVSVNVPFKSLVVDSSNTGGYCLFGVAPAKSNTISLGDPFLANAYVVFDLEKAEISIAQLQHQAGESIHEISKGYIPGTYNRDVADNEAPFSNSTTSATSAITATTIESTTSAEVSSRTTATIEVPTANGGARLNVPFWIRMLMN